MMRLPRIGLGTWHMGESAARAGAEIDALLAGLHAGAGLVDTAEMYADGGAERVLGRALAQFRRAGGAVVADATSGPLVVGKVLPSNASLRGTRQACERSLERLGLDAFDLYLLHWPGPHPLAQTIEAFERLRDDGLIRAWGVSNFDIDAMQALRNVPGGARCAVNQICWSLAQRGVEWDLKPWHDAHGVATMAYSPLDEGRLLRDRRLYEVATQSGIDAGTLALAWLARHPGTCAIPKSASPQRTRENLRAADVSLDTRVLAMLDARFAPPAGPQPLHII